MRVKIVISLLFMLAAAWLIPAAGAETPINIGIPYVIGPGFTMAAPFSQGSYLINAFNASSLACTDTGSFAATFAPADLAPSLGSYLLSPSIAQSTARTLVADRSYFFNDYFSVA